MALIATVLFAVLASTPQSEITGFTNALKAGRNAEAYALMSPAAQKTLGRPQFDAYVASRQRVLGNVTGVTNVRVAKEIEVEHGMTIYEADVRFEKGTAQSWFVLSQDPDKRWRVLRFGLDMPNGTYATIDEKDVMPVIHDMLAVAKNGGVAALADRFSERDLAEVEQTIEGARSSMAMIDAVVGPMESYTIAGTEPDGEELCRTAKGETKFRNGSAPTTLRICWVDGVWRLRHAQFTPQMNPVMLEASLLYALKGNPKVSCPRDAKFPVGGDIVCRITMPGEKPQDVTIRRTTESGWEIVGIANP
jgi:hypothetical protein